MGHVHCGIYENSLLFIISSGLAWCHHAPDNKFERNPTILNFLAGGGEREVRQALRQHHLCGTERAANSTERKNMLRGNFFSFQPIETKFGEPTV